MSDLKKMYKTIMDDNFPDDMTIKFGDQTLIYRKRAWKIPDEKTGELIEKGLRYGENPDQQAALFELVNGNLVLGDCKFIESGNGLVSSITEADMIPPERGEVAFVGVEGDGKKSAAWGPRQVAAYHLEWERVSEALTRELAAAGIRFVIVPSAKGAPASVLPLHKLMRPLGTAAPNWSR